MGRQLAAIRKTLVLVRYCVHLWPLQVYRYRGGAYKAADICRLDDCRVEQLVADNFDFAYATRVKNTVS